MTCLWEIQVSSVLVAACLFSLVGGSSSTASIEVNDNNATALQEIFDDAAPHAVISLMLPLFHCPDSVLGWAITKPLTIRSGIDGGVTLDCLGQGRHLDVVMGDADTSLTLIGLTFINGAGTYTGEGSGRAGSVYIQGAEQRSFFVHLSSCRWLGNYAVQYGGALYIDAGRPANHPEPSENSIEIVVDAECYFLNNTARVGGAIAAAIWTGGSRGVSLSFNGDYISNHADSLHALGSFGAGGAIHVLSPVPTINGYYLVNGTFLNNTAVNHGGAVYIDTSGNNVNQTISLHGVFRGNAAGVAFSGDSSVLRAANGGAIALVLWGVGNSSVVEVGGDYIRNRCSQHGGALFIDHRVDSSGTQVKVVDASMVGNAATRHGGGMMSIARTAVHDMSVKISGCTMHCNSAGSGGGLSLEWVAAEVDDVHAPRSFAVTIANSSFFDNRAINNDTSAQSGGALLVSAAAPGVQNASLLIAGSNFSSNSASSLAGGAIRVLLSTDAGAPEDCMYCVAEGSFFQGFEYYPPKGCGLPDTKDLCAQDALGPLLPTFRPWFYTNVIDIRECFFGGNVADCESCSGGAVSLDNGRVIVSDSTFSNNVARRVGGGLLLGGRATATLSGLVFSGNSAAREHDIASSTPGDLTIFNTSVVTVVPNTTERFAPVGISNGGRLYINGSALSIKCPRGYAIENQSLGVLTITTDWPNPMLATDTGFACTPCPRGQYSLVTGAWVMGAGFENAPCRLCPPFADCNGAADVAVTRGAVGTTLEVGDGALEHDHLLEMVRCPSGYCCPNETCTPFDVCNDNRAGMLCGHCAPNYSEAFGTYGCVADDTCNDTWMLPTAFVTTGVVTLFFTALMNIPIISKKRRESMVLRPEARPGMETATRRRKATFNAQNIVMRESMIATPTRDVVDFDEIVDDGAELKVIAFFYQVFPLVLSQQSREHQNKFIQALFSIFNIEISEGATGLCPHPGMTATQKLAAGYVLPCMLLGWEAVWFIAWAAIVRFRPNRDHRRRNNSDKGYQYRGFAGHFATLFLLVGFCYQSLLETTAQLVACISFGGTNRLFLAGDVVCYTDWQRALLGTVLPLMFLYPILLVWLVYWIKQQSRVGTSVQGIMNNVVIAYRDGWKTQYWESVLMLQRLFLVLISVFSAQRPVWRAWLLAMILLVSYSIQLWLQPFERRQPNILMTLLVGFLLIIACWEVGTAAVSLHGNVFSETTSIAISAIITVLVIVPILIAPIFAVQPYAKPAWAVFKLKWTQAPGGFVSKLCHVIPFLANRRHRVESMHVGRYRSRDVELVTRRGGASPISECSGDSGSDVEKGRGGDSSVTRFGDGGGAGAGAGSGSDCGDVPVGSASEPTAAVNVVTAERRGNKNDDEPPRALCGMTTEQLDLLRNSVALARADSTPDDDDAPRLDTTIQLKP